MHSGHDKQFAGIGAALLRYGVAIMLVAAATVARLSLDSLLGQEVLPYSFFYLAVAVAAWWEGFRPALVTAMLGLFVGIWLIVPPRHTLMIRGLPGFMEIVVYLFVTSIMIALMTSLRKTRAEALANASIAVQKQLELEAEVQRRRQTEEALRRSEALLEQKIKERTAELEETVDELKRFSYAIIHDMRAPLRSVRGFTEIIEEEAADALPASNREYLRRMKTACHRMDRLIQDSLNYNKVLLKKLPLQPVDLSKLLPELCATYANLRPHQAGIRIDGILPVVLGNDAALTQCFSILLGNAVKFVAPGVEPNVLIWAEQNGSQTTIFVRDNGVGIPVATQQHLFGIFQRHDSTHEGTGMGLAIARKLVQRMGGKIGADSAPGKGSRFWMELNLAPSNASSQAPTEEAALEKSGRAQLNAQR